MGTTNGAPELASWLEDLCPSILMIDGFLFLDRDRVGEAALRTKVAASHSVADAQYWNNIILISDFIWDFTSCEDIDDPAARRIFEIWQENWNTRIKSQFPNAKYEIGYWHDDEYGDYGLRLANDLSFRPKSK